MTQYVTVALKQVNELPVPPSQINPKVDVNLERIILKCMEKYAANRFQTADELRAVLNAYATGRAVEVAEPTRVIGGVMPGAGMSAAETRVMSDATQAMVRPAGGAGSTAAGPRVVPPAGGVGAGGYEEEEKRGGKGKIAAIIVGVIAVIAIGVFAATSLFGGSAEMVNVPYVLNQTEEEATKALKDAGFTVKLGEPEESETVEEGRVVDQTPDGNKQAEKGSEVTIIVSSGPKPVKEVEVPNLVGKTADEAEALLSQAGLKGSAQQKENDAEAGTVFQQDTNTGVKVPEGSTITYWISTGPDTATVPGVLGKSEAEATNTLSNAGFTVVSEEGDYSDTYPAGTVMAQSATGETKAGSSITITISKGSNPNIEVPEVTGKSESEAKGAMPSGVHVEVKYEASSSVAKGTVIRQSTSGPVKKGSTVTLTVSSGPASGGSDTNTGTSTGGGQNTGQSGNGGTSELSED